MVQAWVRPCLLIRACRRRLSPDAVAGHFSGAGGRSRLEVPAGAACWNGGGANTATTDSRSQRIQASRWAWQNQPDRFTSNPLPQMPGRNT